MVQRAREEGPVTPAAVPANSSGSDGGAPTTDADLRRDLVAYQAGSVEAFQSLYEALQPPLLRYLRYLTRRADLADDLLQETFLQMHRSRASYDPSYPARPWAFGLARNVYLMNRRTSARFAAVHRSEETMPEVSVPSGLEQWVTGDAVQRAVGSLDAGHAEPLLLHHVWGFSFEEIAGMLGLSPAAARARSSRAMTVLREILSRDEESS